jgi:hypothetical protein
MFKQETKSLEYLSKEIQSSIKSLNINDEEESLLDFEKFFRNKENQSTKKILEDWIDQINSHEKGKGPNSFNFYPSKNSVSCCNLSIGVATKKFGWSREKDKCRTGFKGLIKDIIGHWFRCKNTNKTILLTTDWDKDAFEDGWKQIIDDYVDGTGNEVEIYYLLDKPVGSSILLYPI